MTNNGFGGADTSGESKRSNITPCPPVALPMVDVVVNNFSADVLSTSRSQPISNIGLRVRT